MSQYGNAELADEPKKVARKISGWFRQNSVLRVRKNSLSEIFFLIWQLRQLELANHRRKKLNSIDQGSDFSF